MPDTVKVKGGDSWAKLAKELYGDERMMGELMRANKGVLNLRPGQKLVLPNKVDNPFVSFAQAAYGAGTIEGKKPGSSQNTADLISKMYGGADWLAQAGVAMGPKPASVGSTPYGTPGPRGEALARLNPANTNALLNAGQANIPANRTAQEYAGITSTPRAGVPPQVSIYQGQGATPAAPYSKPSSFASQPKGTTRYLPGQQTGQPLTAGGGVQKPVTAGPQAPAGKQNWLTTPMNQQPWGKALLNAPGQVGGAISNFAQEFWQGAKSSVSKTAQAGKYDANATPFEQAMAALNAPPASPGAQPVNQPTTPKSPQTSTGGNSLSYSPTDTGAENAAWAQALSVVATVEELPQVPLSNAVLIRANVMAGWPPEQAAAETARQMQTARWTLQSGVWKPPSGGTSATPNNSGTGTLDFRNMDISTLVQMGFYDAPTQPTYSTTGRDNTGGSQPAPASSYGLVGGTSWRINP